jgi:NAD(P)-dependent dehydrogenase (short-subunit alcohol dehydrogenase family)
MSCGLSCGVTGGARLGAAIAAELAVRGAAVVVPVTLDVDDVPPVVDVAST